MTDRRAELHSREVIEADRAEFLQRLRQPIDPGSGEWGSSDYRPPATPVRCTNCGAEIHTRSLLYCVVCGTETMAGEYARTLEFERRSPQAPDERASAIRKTFGISPTLYTQRLMRLLNDPIAVEIDAVTVRRLQRRRDELEGSRDGIAPARPARPDPRQRRITYPPRPGIQSPASVPTSTRAATPAEDPAESRATEVSPPRDPVDVAAAGDTYLPGGRTRPAAPAGSHDSLGSPAGDTSEGVRARVGNDRVWGRRGRLQRRPRSLGDHLRQLGRLLVVIWHEARR